MKSIFNIIDEKNIAENLAVSKIILNTHIIFPNIPPALILADKKGKGKNFYISRTTISCFFGSVWFF